MRLALVYLSIISIAAIGCADTVGADGSGAAPGSGGAGGGEMQCEGKTCGVPCATCSEPPCEQVCDGQGECRPAYEVPCTDCPDYWGDEAKGIEAPRTGNACKGKVGLSCEYGTYLLDFVDCRTRVTCGVNGWETENTSKQECAWWDPDATCPMDFPLQGSSCEGGGYGHMCDYGGEKYCSCTSELVPDQLVWGCVEPPAAPCPSVAPLLGHACTDEGLECAYGACWLERSSPDGSALLSTTRACEGGIWVERPLGCPEP